MRKGRAPNDRKVVVSRPDLSVETRNGMSGLSRHGSCRSSGTIRAENGAGGATGLPDIGAGPFTTRATWTTTVRSQAPAGGRGRAHCRPEGGPSPAASREALPALRPPLTPPRWGDGQKRRPRWHIHGTSDAVHGVPIDPGHRRGSPGDRSWPAETDGGGHAGTQLESRATRLSQPLKVETRVRIPYGLR